MKKLLLLAAAGLVIQVTPVLAEHHEGGEHGKTGKMFEKHDLNSDGVISQDEFLEHTKKKFAEKDTNGDGAISKEEAKAAHEAKRAKRKEMKGEMKDKWKEKRQERMKKRASDSAE